jgi:hypothetical protein
VKLAIESEQSIAQTARDLGVNENTLHQRTRRVLMEHPARPIFMFHWSRIPPRIPTQMPFQAVCMRGRVQVVPA